MPRCIDSGRSQSVSPVVPVLPVAPEAPVAAVGPVDPAPMTPFCQGQIRTRGVPVDNRKEARPACVADTG